ncbi:hypothetical protein QTG54_002029 [Skeletonema marinoi]|uniref:Uncharacterized protein n=1 Tax=Skeletonema marinoi TaxID=267567 RepID=A0AAD9DI70_9STRA|nr:hypothetical protein QTG54_002029 [Skeletonema marinoi]
MMMESHEERDEYKRKQQFDYLTSDVLKERKKHALAKIHFNAWGNIIFYISAAITLSQAIMATLAQSKFKEEQGNMNIAIAFFASFSVFWQSLIKHWNYGGKSSMHESAATALGKIYNVALIRARHVRMNMKKKVNTKGATGGGGGSGSSSSATSEGATTGGGDKSGSKPDGGSNVVTHGDGGEEEKSDESLPLEGGEEEKSDESLPLEDSETPDEDSGSSEDQDGSKDQVGSSDAQPYTLTTLTKQFEQAIESCSSQVPAEIAAAFELLDNRVGVCKRKVNNPRKSSESNSQVEWEKVYPTLYRQLTATIISQPLWPYKYPNAEKVVTQTMDKYFKDLDNTVLLKKLLTRNREIDEQYEAFEKGDEIA